MDQIRRTDDGELCGHVDERGKEWFALTVFGAELGRHDYRDQAVDQVLTDGLASLAERWMLRPGGGGEAEVVCIQEANPSGVTVGLGYYSLPGMPSITITVAQLATGEWELTRPH